MGLLDRLSENGLVQETPKPQPVVQDKPLVKKSNSVGLLKKSLNMASNINRLDFFDFIQKYDLQICAVFNSQNGVYCVEHSAGLDGESICLSVSTSDFWDGINPQSDILPFYQFFSAKLKDNLKNLKCYKANDGRIYLFNSSKDVPLSIYSDINNLTFEPSTTSISNANYKIDYSEAIESLVLSQSKTKETKRLIQAISEQLYFNLLQNFPEPSVVLNEHNGKFTIAYCEQQEIPFEVISNHLKFESEFVLGNNAELLSVERCNDCRV